MFRQDGPSSKVLYVKRVFTANVPKTDGLVTFCANNSPRFSYHEGNSTLLVTGKIEESEYRSLLTTYSSQREVHPVLKQLKDESQLYLSDEELADLENYVKRIRGEILFARGWLLCEGQSEYVLLRYFAELLGTPLDQAGISVIDFQNNGSPEAFVGLARTFEIPWIMICDNDDAGKSYAQRVKDRGLTDDEADELIRLLPGNEMDLELFLVKSGFDSEYMTILTDAARSSAPHSTVWVIATQGAPQRQIVVKTSGEYEVREGDPPVIISQSDPRFKSLFDEILVAELQRRDKVRHANALITRLRAIGADESHVPPFIREAIHVIVTKVK
jgi:putative ATP-dependent endonuclease of OLD family